MLTKEVLDTLVGLSKFSNARLTENFDSTSYWLFANGVDRVIARDTFLTLVKRQLVSRDGGGIGSSTAPDVL